MGELVALAEDKNVPLDKLEDFDVSKVHDALASDWRDVFRLETAFKSREKKSWYAWAYPDRTANQALAGYS